MSTFLCIVRETICRIGYDKPSFGFDGNTCGVMIAIDEQSNDIAEGVNSSVEARSGIAKDEWTIRSRRPRPHVRLCHQ